VDLDTYIIAAINRLSSYQIAPEVQWVMACDLIALKYGWTTDEASANLANLLANLGG
jgi:hypothetical protein